jgi:hypothetical protein
MGIPRGKYADYSIYLVISLNHIICIMNTLGGFKRTYKLNDVDVVAGKHGWRNSESARLLPLMSVRNHGKLRAVIYVQ